MASKADLRFLARNDDALHGAAVAVPVYPSTPAGLTPMPVFRGKILPVGDRAEQTDRRAITVIAHMTSPFKWLYDTLIKHPSILNTIDEELARLAHPRLNNWREITDVIESVMEGEDGNGKVIRMTDTWSNMWMAGGVFEHYRAWQPQSVQATMLPGPVGSGPALTVNHLHDEIIDFVTDWINAVVTFCRKQRGVTYGRQLGFWEEQNRVAVEMGEAWSSRVESFKKAKTAMFNSRRPLNPDNVVEDDMLPWP